MKPVTSLLGAFLLLASSLPAFATGAIAISEGDGSRPGYGFSVRQPSRGAAEHRALRKCEEQNNECRVVMWFDVCGAYALSREHAGIGYGRSESRAEEEAMDACGSRGCHIVISVCE